MRDSSPRTARWAHDNPAAAGCIVVRRLPGAQAPGVQPTGPMATQTVLPAVSRCATLSFMRYCTAPLIVLLMTGVTAAADGPAWDARLFDYRRPAHLEVEESTPADAHVQFLLRPPRIDPKTPLRPGGPATRRAVGDVDVVRLCFRNAEGSVVPALLCTPAKAKGPFPLVIAVHGFMSNKTQVCYQVAPAFSRRGYAVLAADMPCHGERPGNPQDFVDMADLVRSYVNFRDAVVTIRQLIDLAEERPDIDHKAGVVLLGYSMGSWISSVTGAADKRVSALVLMVGGTPAFAAEAVRQPRGAALDPRLAMAAFAGRPVLMLNGRNDRLVPPDWAERLFAACREPRRQIWYDSGHFLPARAFEDAADWAVSQTAPLRSATRPAGR